MYWRVDLYQDSDAKRLYLHCNSIVNPEKKIVGIGYNGFPNQCGDDELPWARESETNSPLDTKYPVRNMGTIIDCLVKD